ncbi:MAG: hypothetical protein ACREA9_02850 [Pyrinomonadaceae bacterium]
MTICPCCGFKSANSGSGVSTEACLSCGAHSVGEPLPRPEHELPSYGRSLLLAVTGALTVLVFLSQTIIALVQSSSRAATSTLALSSIVPLDFLSWLAAAETAAWRLKWLAIPLTALVVFGSRRIYRSIRQSPTSFCGLRYARNGYFASAAVPLLVLILIGITVPERLRHRQWGIEARDYPYIHRIDRAFDEYRQLVGSLPGEPKDLLKRLPDADGSIAEALKNLDTSNYKPTAELAAVPNKQPQLRGAVIRNASLSTADDSLGERLSFTNYELPLPGPDKIMGTEDDLIVRDGVIDKASETPHRGVSTTSATRTRQP